MRTILLVLFVMTMFLWLLAALGAVAAGYSPWLAWFTCLWLGLVVFVPAGGGKPA